MHTAFFDVSAGKDNNVEPRWFHRCRGPWHRRGFIVSIYHEPPYCKDIIDENVSKKLSGVSSGHGQCFGWSVSDRVENLEQK